MKGCETTMFIHKAAQEGWDAQEVARQIANANKKTNAASTNSHNSIDGKETTRLSKKMKAVIAVALLAVAIIATLVGMHFNGGINQNLTSLSDSAQHSIKHIGKALSGLNGDAALGVFGGLTLFGILVVAGGFFLGKCQKIQPQQVKETPKHPNTTNSSQRHSKKDSRLNEVCMGIFTVLNLIFTYLLD